MATISVSLPEDGTTADVSDYNTPITTVVNAINGNIDNDNIKAAAAIAGSKIADGAVTAAKMQYGMVRNRQGGTTGDATWATGGASNTDTSAKAVFIQAGSVTGATGTVTFPTTYTYAPLVFVSVMSAGTQNVWARAKDVTATNFVWQIFINTTTNGTSETVSWLAIGQ